MQFTRGESIRLQYAEPLDGMVTEVVPAGALPRTVSQSGFRPRGAESYVVTVLAPRQIRTFARGQVRNPSLGCRRLWPDPALLAPRQKGIIYA